MESHPSFDISWLHHSHNKDHHNGSAKAHDHGRQNHHHHLLHHHQPASPATQPSQPLQPAAAATGAVEKQQIPSLLPEVNQSQSLPQQKDQQQQPAQNQTEQKPSAADGSSDMRIFSDKQEVETDAVKALNAKSKTSKGQLSPGLGRRTSWISNISSKFSSSNNSSNQSSPSPASPGIQKSSPADAARSHPTTQNTGSPVANDVNGRSPPPSSSPPAPQASPSKSSFLSSALRRLSSSSGGSSKTVTGTGGICPRKVMNLDPYRERCQIDNLHQSKLRRVAFCVDVEIAAPVRYTDEETKESSPPPPARRPSLTLLEKQVEARKAKERSVKQKELAEGEALKRPDDVAAAKDQLADEGVGIDAVEETLDETPNPASADSDINPFDSIDAAGAEVGADPDATGPAATTRKREKKRKSEEERKAKKERKRQSAIANGQIPLEIAQDENSSGTSTPNAQGRNVRVQNSPTTDPLRIYRRCCQLRETPILKRITDQLANPACCDPNEEGIVTCLDITGLRMPITDVVTFSDYLAVVPIKKLIMEDCNLTDEGVRIILAGLLAAKTPEQAKFNKHLAKKNDETTLARTERLGVIEKLSLKNNPNLGIMGWTYICQFIHMSRSLKAIDLSMIALPREEVVGAYEHLHHKNHGKKSPTNICNLLAKCLTGRLSSIRLEEVVMGECELQTEQVEKLVSAIAACGVTRLGLANNNLTTEGLQCVATFVATGNCEGLDLGGNNLSDNLSVLIDAMKDKDNAIYALSLADCALTTANMKTLLPRLAQLSNFKFIDLSHNRALFSAQSNALFLLRKYLPQMQVLKRIHLNDVDMSPEQCISLAEILPEIPSLAHIGVLDNPKLGALASAKDEVPAEEACAFYASLMAAVRVSKTIVSVDVDMPTGESSELVQALGKQILAYALRNMERGAVIEAANEGSDADSGTASATGVGKHESVVEVPDIIMHLIGHMDDQPENNHDNDPPAPSEDYIVSGTGVVKALGICLAGNAHAESRASRDATPMGRLGSGTITPVGAFGSGAATPRGTTDEVAKEVGRLKAKEMSLNLLSSARKIRARLQPALVREAKNGDEMNYRKLQFLDSTLSRMIERFEEEYPECRPRRISSSTTNSATTPTSDQESLSSSANFSDPFRGGSLTPATDPSVNDDGAAVDDDDADPDDARSGSPTAHQRRLSRHGSDVSLASKTLNDQEAQMHRFGQQIRRSMLRLRPQSKEEEEKSREEVSESKLESLRAQIEALTGGEIEESVRRRGVAGLLKELGSNEEELRLLEQSDPEAFERWKEAAGNAEGSVMVGKEGNQ